MLTDAASSRASCWIRSNWAPIASDNAVAPDVYACFFSDGGVGMAGALYRDGTLSHVNRAAARLGARPGMALRAFVDILTAGAKRP